MGLLRSISKLFGHHRGSSRPSIPEGYEMFHPGPLAIGTRGFRPRQIQPQVSAEETVPPVNNFQATAQPEQPVAPFNSGLREIQGMMVGPNLSEQYNASAGNLNSQRYETPVQMLLEGGQRSESNNRIQRRSVTIQPYDYFNQSGYQ
jgi:hypothetical protein